MFPSVGVVILQSVFYNEERWRMRESYSARTPVETFKRERAQFLEYARHEKRYKLRYLPTVLSFIDALHPPPPPPYISASISCIAVCGLNILYTYILYGGVWGGVIENR